VQATWNNDFTLLSGIVLFFGVVYVGMNFVADMLYALVDPRIRYS
jgi:ABC-type dipeptide/oligopeptide/nickel transport system permease component